MAEDLCLRESIREKRRNDTYRFDNFHPIPNLSNSILIKRTRETLQTVSSNDYIKFQGFAWDAMMAYCLDEKRGMITSGIYAETIVRDEQIILRMRGKEKMKGEWQERSNRWMKYPGVEDAMVDAEFYEEFLKTKRVILFQLMNRIKSAKTNRITAVGHGIGGVHAIFALLEIREIRKNLELMVVTYGQPHIGNREFANYINSLVIDMPVVRITLFDDFVPRMPFTTYRNYYVHHLHELWIGPPKCDCPSDKEDVYWCVGSEIRQENGDLEINESLDCNLKYSEFRSNSHNGPYFNVYMGNCLQSSPPWVH